jgi:rhodanese-related sulfurtransferase
MTEAAARRHAAPLANYVDIDPLQLSACAPNTRIVDVREDSEFVGALCHIPGAQLAPLRELAARAQDWDKDLPVVLVCRSGRRSAEAAALLARMGFRQVLNLRGGMEAYRASGLPTECGPCRR